MEELLTATGFLLCSDDDTDQNELNTPDIRHSVLQQTGEIVAGNLFALTVQCAKRHNHKYEAIRQLDYYRWLANCSPVFNPQRWVTSVEHGITLNVSKQERETIDRQNSEIDTQVAELIKKRDVLRDEYRQRLCREKLTTLPEGVRTAAAAALDIPARKRSEQKQLAEQLVVSAEDITAALKETDGAVVGAITADIRALRSHKTS